MNSPPELFANALRQIYESAVDPQHWPEALGAIEELSGSAGAIINLVSKCDSTPTRTIAGARMLARYDPALFEEYDLHLARDCPRVRAGISSADAPYLCDYMILDERRMDRNPVYDWYTRQDVRYFVGSSLAETERYRIMWSLQRSNAQQHAQSADIDLFLKLKPHVQKAVLFSSKFECLQMQQALNDTILEALPHAVFVLDQSRAVVLANTRGERLLRDQDGLRLHERKLIVDDPNDGPTFERLFDACRNWSDPGAMQICRPSGKIPYILSVMPVATVHGWVAPQACVVVTVQDASKRETRKIETLVQLFGFTRAEATLAGALGSGHSLASAAHSHGISLATARVHLKSVFRKARVNRQADLVRLIASVSPFGLPLDREA